MACILHLSHLTCCPKIPCFHAIGISISIRIISISVSISVSISAVDVHVLQRRRCIASSVVNSVAVSVCAPPAPFGRQRVGGRGHAHARSRSAPPPTPSNTVRDRRTTGRKMSVPGRGANIPTCHDTVTAACILHTRDPTTSSRLLSLHRRLPSSPQQPFLHFSPTCLVELRLSQSTGNLFGCPFLGARWQRCNG